jgi:hypothetical protein
LKLSSKERLYGASKKDRRQEKNQQRAALGFEATLWAMADKQRGHMDEMIAQ